MIQMHGRLQGHRQNGDWSNMRRWHRRQAQDFEVERDESRLRRQKMSFHVKSNKQYCEMWDKRKNIWLLDVLRTNISVNIYETIARRALLRQPMNSSFSRCYSRYPKNYLICFFPHTICMIKLWITIVWKACYKWMFKKR